jgi:DNA-binding LacI/PurR family transcriptional regulator
MVKLTDVARAAGVSRGTASNVFTHPELVRPALRERVHAAAAALGYSGPNPKGRLLRAGKVNAIGVTPPGAFGIRVAFEAPYMREFLKGVSQACDDRGASLTLISGVGDDKTRGIRNALVDGFILHRIEDSALIEARRRRLPFVLIDMDGDAEASSVRIDDRGGAQAAATYLAGLGHRRFMIFSVLRQDTPDASVPGPEPIFHPPNATDRRLRRGFVVDDERLAGYADGLGALGISIDAVPIIECRAETVESALPGAALLFERARDVTAVLAMTDIQALAVIEEAQRRGIRVPGDLSVVGFDDIPEAALGRPALTTVIHPMIEKGRKAADIVFDGGPPEHVKLPVSLAVRASAGPASAAGR